MKDAALFRWLISNRSHVEAAIVRGIRTTVREHGAVTSASAPSAAKRVVSELKQVIRTQRRKITDERKAERRKEEGLIPLGPSWPVDQLNHL